MLKVLKVVSTETNL